jgi:transposase
MPDLLRLSRLNIDALERMNKQLLHALKTDHTLAARVERLMTVPGVGQILSLTWALEMGDIARFASVKDAISLLRTVRSRAQLGRQIPTQPDFQAT